MLRQSVSILKLGSTVVTNVLECCCSVAMVEIPSLVSLSFTQSHPASHSCRHSPLHQPHIMNQQYQPPPPPTAQSLSMKLVAREFHSANGLCKPVHEVEGSHQQPHMLVQAHVVAAAVVEVPPYCPYPYARKPCLQCQLHHRTGTAPRHHHCLHSGLRYGGRTPKNRTCAAASAHQQHSKNGTEAALDRDLPSWMSEISPVMLPQLELRRTRFRTSRVSASTPAQSSACEASKCAACMSSHPLHLGH